MQLSVRLDDELGGWLKAHAEEESRTMGQVVRLALNAYRAAQRAPKAPKPVPPAESPVEAVARVRAPRHVRDETPPVTESREARQERARKVMAAAEGSKAFYRETVEPITKKGR